MSASRLGIFVAVILLAVTTRVLLPGDEASDTGSDLPRPSSDYALEDFELTAMNRKGQRSFNLTAPRLEKDPADESARVIEPRLAIYEDAGLTWRVAARDGWVRADGGEIRLHGDVALVSNDPDPVEVSSDALTIYPEQRTLATEAPVTMRRGGNIMTGVGLRADLGTNRWELLSNVKTRFETADS